MVRIGLVDFDTSHVVEFTKRFNHLDVDAAQWVEGGKVVAGCPGDSAIMPERIPEYVAQLKKYNIELVEKPSDLIGKIDAVMIESQQGARHLERARPFLQTGLPTFVDKPFAGSLREADEMIALARKHKAPLMSSSALRYDPSMQEAIAKKAQLGRILSADIWSSAPTHPGNPGLLHYGVHGVEMLFTLLGAGCKEVWDVSTQQGEVAMGLWPSGLLGVMRGIRDGNQGFGFTAHYEKGHFTGVSKGADFYRELLKAVVKMFETRQEPIDLEETRQIMAFMEAAQQSSASHGKRITL